jgi:hypothetical protein
MALLPSLAAIGSQKAAHDVQTLEAANTTVQSTQVAG